MRRFLGPPADHPVAPGSVPTFSIVIPAFEAASFIDRAVESALAQTALAVQIIVSDDGSTDDLPGVLERYRDRVQFLTGTHAGPSAARNRGFRAASGEFVVNLDADDVAHPEWLEALGELAAARPDLDILTTDGYLVHEGRRVRRLYSGGWVFSTEDQRLSILERCFISSLSAVRRRRFLEIGGFDESLLCAGDWDFWLRLVLDGARVGCVEEPLVEYTVREGSISTRRMDVLRGSIRLLEKADRDAALEPHERESLALSLGEKRRDLARREVQEALLRRAPGARRRALATAAAPGYMARTRLKMAAAALAPVAARRLLEKRNEEAWVGAGGTAVRRTLRVAFYCDSDQIAGAEVSLANLLGGLDSRIDAVVLGTRSHILEWIAPHRPATATMVLPRITGKIRPRAISAHFRAIRRLRPDILQVNMNGPWASPWAILSGLAVPGVRVVCVEHLPQPITHLRRRVIKGLTAPRLAAHVAVGERSAAEVARLSGVARNRVRTIYNGVPDLELAPLPRLTDGSVIGSVGRLTPQKGYDLLVRALSELPDVTAVLVGEGSGREQLVQLARSLGVSERLVLAGWSDEPRRYLTTFDIFVLPSRFEGGPPLVVIEAMLAGLPIVATDVDDVSEAVVDGETGLLVPPGDAGALAHAVRELLDDPARRRELGRSGRQRALARFSVAAMAEAYEALYDEVVR